MYVSSNDRALIMSRLVNRAARLGQSTLTPDQLEEAVLVTEMIDPDGSVAIALVDVTPINHCPELPRVRFGNAGILRRSVPAPDEPVDAADPACIRSGARPMRVIEF